jgi:uncharacterized repeat protein (TIGR03803 family)
VVNSFAGANDGYTPVGGLVLDSQGNLYGTTQGGGNNPNNGNLGYGTVFKIAPDGTEIILHSFGQNSTDGGKPLAGLIITAAGTLYGTTSSGGAFGWGAIFSIDARGAEKVIYSFCANGIAGGCTDGAVPWAKLLLKNGILYGTTYDGGANDIGTVFQVTLAGVETVLHSFQGGTDGASPVSGLVMDRSGNLYGTAQFGGLLCSQQRNLGCGVVFRIAPDSSETIVHTFQGGSDGAVPVAGLIMDGAGDLFGATESGGVVNNGLPAGTIFEIPAGGTEGVLYTSAQMTGRGPEGDLLLKGSFLYGTNFGGGLHSNKGGYGVVFELKK